MSATTAQGLTQAIESIEEKVKNSNAERQQLVAELRSVIDSARSLLADLGETDGTTPRSARRGRPPGSGKAKRGPGRPKGTGKPGRPKGRKMSAAARKRISEAQKARWAKQKAAAGKK